MDIRHEIDIFINNIKEKYENIKIVCRYDEANNDYMINHNRPDLDYMDTKFIKYIEDLYCETFLDKNIYNVYFGYDVGEFPETGEELEAIANKIAPINTRKNDVLKTIVIKETLKKFGSREYFFENIGLEDSKYLQRDKVKSVPNYIN